MPKFSVYRLKVVKGTAHLRARTRFTRGQDGHDVTM